MQSKWMLLGIIYYQTLEHWESKPPNPNASIFTQLLCNDKDVTQGQFLCGGKLV